jgi:hypothetical protein
MRAFEHDASQAASLHDRTVAVKEQLRAQDEDALRSGRLTAREINRKNAVISGRHLELDLTSGGRLR